MPSREILTHCHWDFHIAEFCLDATYLAFRRYLYRQIHGITMGSPVSVTVANLVMEDIEQRALANFPNPPKVWKRYVDDTCCALATSAIDRFHQHINSIEPHIQFNIEIETNAEVPFFIPQSSNHPQPHEPTSVIVFLHIGPYRWRGLSHSYSLMATPSCLSEACPPSSKRN